MIFSRPTSYAVRALVYLAHHYGRGPVLGSDIAKGENLPAPFLAKLMRELTSSGIVKASRGPGGGFVLGRDPRQISLWDVFTQYDGLALSGECLLGCGTCSEDNSCYVHAEWAEPKAVLKSFLKRTSIADLAARKTAVQGLVEAGN
ncbi:Rrf2 family transcriptional regulator [bacterium]|nr:Rrf2 family transcriptional regulator [bacterium]